MGKALSSIVDEVRHAAAIWYGAGPLVDLIAEFGRSTNAVGKAQVAEEIADALNSHANHLDRSRLARVTTMLPPADDLRRHAAEWRRKATTLWAAAKCRNSRRGRRLPVLSDHPPRTGPSSGALP